MAGAAAGGTGTATVPAESDDDFEDEEDLSEEGEGAEGDKPKGTKKSDEDEFDPERAKRTIEAQRASEKKLKATLKELQGELKAIKDKDLPAAEQQAAALKEAQDKATAAEAMLQKSIVRTAALEEATKLGFRNPALAYKLIDQDDVDWDDNEPANIRSLLKKMLEDDPYLKGGRRRKQEDEDEEGDDDDADAGAGRNRRTSKGFDFNAEIRRAAGH